MIIVIYARFNHYMSSYPWFFRRPIRQFRVWRRHTTGSLTAPMDVLIVHLKTKDARVLRDFQLDMGHYAV